jgi:hypothetical protein
VAVEAVVEVMVVVLSLVAVALVVVCSFNSCKHLLL